MSIFFLGLSIKIENGAFFSIFIDTSKKCIDKRHTLYYINNMTFNWDERKNRKLKEERGISFEQILYCIHNNGILDILEHPNKKKYKNQRLYIINIDNYAYVVPFIDKKDERFLITVFPSRKYTEKYFRKEK